MRELIDCRQFNILAPKPVCKQESTIITDSKWNYRQSLTVRVHYERVICYYACAVCVHVDAHV